MRALVTVAALALVAGCSASPTSSPPSPPSPAASSAAPSSPATSPSASPSASADDSAPSTSIGKVGGRGVALTGGVIVSVGKIKTYPDTIKPGNGITRGGDQFAVIPITLTNKGTKPIVTSLTAVLVTARGEQLDAIMEPDLYPTNDGFPGTLLPGKARTATFGYALRKGDLGDLQIEVWPLQTEPHAILNTTGSTT